MVMRPFLQRHLPFLLGTNSKRIDQAFPYACNNNHPVTVLNLAVEYRAEVSAGWALGQRSSFDTHATAGTTADDVEMGGESDWPLRSDIALGTEMGNNIVEENCYKE